MPAVLRSTDAADYQDLARPVAVMAKDFARGTANAPHRHKRGQLICIADGVAAVTTPDGTWVVPPQRAVWVPAETEHWVRCPTAATMRALFIMPDVTGLPDRCCVIAVSPLLRELISRAADFPVDYDETGSDGRVMALILDEIRALPALPLHLPRPADARLRRVCEALKADPADNRTLENWARASGASARTLARLFRKETGLSFGGWRQQARLLEALGRLASGSPVTTVALDLGYQSPSAFTSMFRRALGTSPTRYFAAESATGLP
ncbi:MAG TPA: helix-turn-helix transcriptional regulator [Stellaceae bacterium]|jgi:AraC-like DNA-binding protein/quercetin dioxygenase-like cupin family protein|nr:helix-turn-helix transcriptional regulator [Stellaceae bacterium]